MHLINKDTDYAVRALLVLAGAQGEYVSSRQIAEVQEIPLPFVRRILQILVREKLAESREGKRGGVRLIKDPGMIRLSDVIRMFQGEIQLSDCMFRKKLCPNRPNCVLRRRLGVIEQKMIDEFKWITIQALLNDIQNERGQTPVSVKKERKCK
jgi:Rrf2 family cysteine metabolism transcriptional repressor